MSNDLGIDRSGNGNNWTVNNMAFADQVVDSPTNNFATLNPLTKRPAANGILSEGNLSFKSQTGDSTVFATMGILPDQKIYFEVYLQANSNQNFIGISPDYDNGDGDFDKVGVAYGRKVRGGATVQQYYNGGGDSSGTDLSVNNQAVGTVVGVAVDNENGQIHYAFNNSWDSDATDNNPAADVTGFDTTVTQFPKISLDTPDNTAWDYLNFGQDSSFAGNKTAQGNQDGNEIGDFYYTPPSGYLALCTKNLPDVDVVPSENFNAQYWSGDSSGDESFTTGFQPDWVWFSVRSLNASHEMVDSVRGATKGLMSDTDGAEYTDAEGLQSFDSNGFSLGTNSGGYNRTGRTYVARSWKAGGTAVSNTDGSITSTVSANVDTGFSIVGYTGNGSDGATVGHGLSSAPDMVIVKSRDSAHHWSVGHTSLGTNEVVLLSTNSAKSNCVTGFTGGGVGARGASTFTLEAGTSNANNVNTNNEGFIAYCFHSVDGYSKVGSYTGNGSTDGTFVYTGFRPAFVLTKCSSHGSYGSMTNNKTLGYNPDNNELYAGLAQGEATSDSLDYLANGFKMRRTSGEDNGSSKTYIYIAFAETPFKYSNAR
jgi:hypothetical protein